MNYDKEKIMPLEKFLQEEVLYFNKIATDRFSRGIPCEADMNTETYYEPKNINEELIDSQLKKVLLDPMRQFALNAISKTPDGLIYDICCGPGWFSLEMARRGREVIGFDISNEAISMAENMWRNEQNKCTGSIKYSNKSAENDDIFRDKKVSGVMGWSAFHHLENPEKFLMEVYKNIQPGGVVVTFDDLDSNKTALFFRYLLKFILPIYEYTYFEKLKKIINYIFGNDKLEQMQHSPMEIYSDKHGDAAEVIRECLVKKYTPIYEKEFGAFSIYVSHSLKMPRALRLKIAKMIVLLDELLCKLRICKGSYRIIVSKKI